MTAPRSVWNPWRPEPPPEEPPHPRPPHPRAGGYDDEAGELEEAERILGQWPAAYQGDLAGALAYVRARRA